MNLSALHPALLVTEGTGTDEAKQRMDKVEHARALLMEAASKVDWLWWQHGHGVDVFKDEVAEAQSAKSVAERAVKFAKDPGAGLSMLTEKKILEAMKVKLKTLHVNALPRHMAQPLLPLPKSLQPEPEPEPEPEPMPPPPPRPPPKDAHAFWKKGAAVARAREEAERKSEELVAILQNENMRPRTRSGKGKS
tara:strand:- start:27465 stop:28043 length:579 start_codon:yes stop_codon:yes gene_type:complete